MARIPSAVVACALLVGAFLGCARPAPTPANPPVAVPATGDTTELTGILTRKGPAETSFWAVTDPDGKVFQIVETTPQLEARFRDLQNGRVTFRVERRGRVLLEQVRVTGVLLPAP